jgi:hypothetical protein
MVAMVTNVTIDFLATMFTLVIKVTNVCMMTIVTKVTEVRWLLWLGERIRIVSSADISSLVIYEGRLTEITCIVLNDVTQCS